MTVLKIVITLYINLIMMHILTTATVPIMMKLLRLMMKNYITKRALTMRLTFESKLIRGSAMSILLVAVTIKVEVGMRLAMLRASMLHSLKS